MDSDQFWSVLTAAVAVMFAIVLPNGTTLPATREAGLVQIAKARFQMVLVLETWFGLWVLKNSARISRFR